MYLLPSINIHPKLKENVTRHTKCRIWTAHGYSQSSMLVILIDGAHIDYVIFREGL